MKRGNRHFIVPKETDVMVLEGFKNSLKTGELLKKSGVMPALLQTARCQNV